MSEVRGVVGQLAAAIADREPIHWADLERLAKSDRDQSLLRQLRAVAWLESRSRSEHSPAVSAAINATPILWVLVLSIACLQILGGVVVLAVLQPSLDLLGWFRLAITASFSAAAGLLVIGRDDGRARSLAHVYLLTAAAFAQPLLAPAAGQFASASLLYTLYPKAFLPFALWRFLRDFPRATRFTAFDRVSPWMTAMAAAVGTVLFVNGWYTATWAVPPGEDLGQVLWLFRGTGTAVPFWLVLLPLMMVSLVTSVWRIRVSPRDERRRAVFFLTALALGVLPLFAVAVLRGASAQFQQFMDTTHPLRGLVDAIVLTSLLSVPFSTSYAVLVHRVLTVRVVVHRAIRRALARYTLTILIVAPIVVPVLQAYRYRDRTVEQILIEPQSRFAALLMVLGMVLLALRSRLVAFIDRRFAGEPRNRTKALALATEAIGRGRTVREVALEAAAQIEATLASSPIGILIRQRDNGFGLVHGAVPPLPDETALLALLGEAPAVILDVESPMFPLLPPADQEWLRRGQFEVVARVPFPDREVAGVVGIGSRRTGIPYSPHDLSFISAILTTAGLAMHRPWANGSGEAVRDFTDVGAVECVRCGVLSPDLPRCACGTLTRPALLPPTLDGKYDVQRRIGGGGMGVVYLGTDTRLGRPVALKTLPHVSPEAAAAMLSEARAMAAVEHPNLAVIYALEVWRGTPVLVEEYLAGGTLDRRLLDGPMPVSEALDLGVRLAETLSALHRAGVLHRDIKPSNIGFTKADIPKLLDFGIARLFEHVESARIDADVASSRHAHAATSTAVAGTPLYLPPEALNGELPGPAVDLWGASVVVLEAIVGSYPFGGRSAHDAVRRIRAGRPDWSRWRPLLPESVAALFVRALDPDPDRRQASAEILASDFRAAAAQCTAAPTTVAAM